MLNHSCKEISLATTGEVEKDTSKVAWISWRRHVQKYTKIGEICAVRLVARKHTHQTKVVSSGKTNTVKLKYRSKVQVQKQSHGQESQKT